MEDIRLRLEKLLQPLPDTLLVAVSGGVDSIALLHALVQAGKKPVVLHFNHSWRKESAQDQALVRALARTYGLKFISAQAKPASVVKKQEAEARKLRYAFFSKTAVRLKLNHLVLAHQADDQVETYLLQLFRGSGSGGQGMQVVSAREGLKLYRPWLGIWREEIVRYARLNRLVWREDESNRDVRYRRNFIRHRLLPYLQKNISPHIQKNLWRAAEIHQAEQAYWDELCQADAQSARLSMDYLRALPLARQRKTLFLWLQYGGIKDISFQDVEAVRGLMDKVLPAKVNLAEGRFARRQAGKLFLA